VEPEDPKALIRQTLEMGDEFPGPAPDILLSWMLSLSVGIDAATAARTLVERYAEAMAAPVSHPAAIRLREMLRETASLAGQPTRAGKRRGGWQGRRGES
jgi:hypothetical protein